MKPRHREVQVFSVSFLDVLSCALGGTLLLLLLLQQSQEDSENSTPSSATNQVAELKKQLKEEKDRRSRAENERDQARNELQEQQATEFWVLSIHVTQTADADGNRFPEDFRVNYYVSLSYEGSAVRGDLFGVQDIGRDDGATDSFGQAEIKGNRSGNRITFDLVYQGEAAGDIERVEAVLTNDEKMAGEICSVKSLPAHRGYEGPLTGTRLTP